MNIDEIAYELREWAEDDIVPTELQNLLNSVAEWMETL